MYLFKDQSHHLMKIVKRLNIIYTACICIIYACSCLIEKKTPVLNINIMCVKVSSDSTLNFYENYLNQFFQICCFKR